MAEGVSISVFYFALLGALGIFWPYFSLYLASLGFAPAEITLVLALTPVMSLVTPPLAGLVADARRARVWLLRAGSAATALAFSGFFVARGARSAVWVTAAVFAFCRAPLTSLADATAVASARRHGGSYGALRSWGSVGFLVAALGGGALLQAHGVDRVLAATSVALALAATAAWWIPAPPLETRPRTLDAWLRMIERKELWLLLAAVALGQTAGAAYDACFSLHLHRLGLGERFVGAAWAIGVGAEVVLLLLSSRLFGRFGADRVLVFSLAVAAGRWLLLAHVRAPEVLLWAQPLHGVSFGLFWVSSVTLTSRHAGLETPTAGQGLLAAAYGLGSVVGMTFAGRLLERGGGRLLYTSASLVAALAAGCAGCYVASARRNAREPMADGPAKRIITGDDAR